MAYIRKRQSQWLLFLLIEKKVWDNFLKRVAWEEISDPLIIWQVLRISEIQISPAESYSQKLVFAHILVIVIVWNYS